MLIFRRLAPLLPLIGVVLAVLVTVGIMAVPRPVARDADPREFSAERAMSHIETLADEPHSLLDREAHARARDDVIAMFTELGYQPEIHAHPVKLQQFPGVEKLDGVNAESIVVRIPGTSDRTLMMMAHYDSAFSSESTATLEPGTSHGAADDGYGVATIVETLRALRAEGRQLANSLLVVITDAEEAGMVGATNEFEYHSADYNNVELVINIEARGMNGPALMFETSRDNAALLDLFLRYAPDPVTTSMLPSVYRMMPNGTDLSIPLSHGFTGLNIAAIGEGDHYHHATDSPEFVDLGSLQHYGNQVLAVSRAWLFDANAPQLEADSDADFFPVWRGVVVRYPTQVGIGIGVAAVALAVAAIVLRTRSEHWRRVLGTVWGLVWRSTVIGAAAWLVQQGVSALGWGPPAGGLGPNPLLDWEFWGIAIAGIGWLAWFLVQRWRAGLKDETTAAVLSLLAIGAVVFMIVMPGGAYTVTLTLAVTALTVLLPMPWRLPAAALSALAVGVLFSMPIMLVHMSMSMNQLAVPVLFSIIPVGALTLLVLQSIPERASAR
ncbi:MAG: M20/M25/M40 family metallo-hydrolase [Propionibacterium sp.]|jgi:aminopeptidase|nr:M20/M25/M40 family metallo-hydrolase [Propionibacterium sp.]